MLGFFTKEMIGFNMKTTKIMIKRKTRIKLLNAFPLNSLRKGFNWGVAIKEIPLNQAIDFLKKNKFYSYIRHNPLIEFISKKTKKRLKLKPFKKAVFNNDDVLICFVLKERTNKSGEDKKINGKNLRVFLISIPFNDLEEEVSELGKFFEKDLTK